MEEDSTNPDINTTTTTNPLCNAGPRASYDPYGGLPRREDWDAYDTAHQLPPAHPLDLQPNAMSFRDLVLGMHSLGARCPRPSETSVKRWAKRALNHGQGKPQQQQQQEQEQSESDGEAGPKPVTPPPVHKAPCGPTIHCPPPSAVQVRPTQQRVSGRHRLTMEQAPLVTPRMLMPSVPTSPQQHRCHPNSHDTHRTNRQRRQSALNDSSGSVVGMSGSSSPNSSAEPVWWVVPR